MRKLLILLVIMITLILSGCDIFGPRTTTAGSTTANQATTATTIAATTTSTIITTTATTTVATTVTTVINDEITLVLNAGQDTVEINTNWSDGGAKFILNDSEYNMTTTDTVNNSTLGLYEITYSYDYNSEIYSITRYVIVIDQIAPVIELNLGVDTVKVGDIWTDGGITITDNSSETLTATVSGTVNINAAGTYEITYTATDSSSNTSNIIRYVTVIE